MSKYTMANVIQSAKLWARCGGEDRRIGWGLRSPVRHPVGFVAYWVGVLLNVKPAKREGSGSRGSARVCSPDDPSSDLSGRQP